MTFRFLNAGMPRTGTRSFCKAMMDLGFETIHYCPERVPINSNLGWSTLREAYKDMEAAADYPASVFWKELVQTFGCSVILTVRENNSWWESMRKHAHRVRECQYARQAHLLMFGSGEPIEFLWRRRYVEHNESVTRYCAHFRVPILILGLDEPDSVKWEKLCTFVGARIPTEPFPHRGADDGT